MAQASLSTASPSHLLHGLHDTGASDAHICSTMHNNAGLIHAKLTHARGYQWSRSIGTVIGYLMFDLDYESKDFLYDAEQQGWLLNLKWKF